MKPLPYFLSFLWIALAIPTQAQQITLKGQISIHNSKYRTGTLQYVENAEVSADSASPTTSDRQGQYQLEFVGLKEGTAVDLSVAKANLEIVNESDLQNVIVGRRTRLKIFLTPLDQMAQARTELFDISLKALTRKHEQLITELRKGGEESQAIVEALEQRLNREVEHRFEAEEILNIQLEEAKKRLPESVKQLTAVNLDFSSLLYTEAFELYKKGEIESALNKIDEAELDKSAQKSLINIASIEKEKEEYLVAKEQQIGRISQIVNSYQLKGEGYNLLFEYRKAVGVFLKSIRLLEITHEKEDMDLANAYDRTGSAYHDLGEFPLALKYQQKSIDIKEKICKKNDPELVYSYSNLALIYQDLGEYDKALINLDKVSSIILSGSDLEPSLIASFYNNLGQVYLDLGNFEEALKIQLSVDSIYRTNLGIGHVKIATSSNNLALLYRNLGKYEEALDAIYQAIDIQRKVLRPNDPFMANSYNNLASIYLDLEEYQKALEASMEACKIYERSLDANHPSLANSYTTLATIYFHMEEFEDALKIQLKALNIQIKTLRANHPNLADTYNNIASINTNLGEHQEAIVVQGKAIAIYKKVLPNNHPKIANALVTLGGIYYDIGDYNKAISYYQESHSLASDNEIIYQNNMGLAYARSGNFSKAKYHFEQLQRLIPNAGVVYRDWVLFYALKDDKNQSLENLEKAIQLGYNNLNWLTTEKALDPIREDPIFKKIIEQLQNEK